MRFVPSPAGTPSACRWLDASGVEVIAAYVHPDNLASGRVAGYAGLAATGKIVDGDVAWRREVRLEPAY